MPNLQGVWKARAGSARTPGVAPSLTLLVGSFNWSLWQNPQIPNMRHKAYSLTPLLAGVAIAVGIGLAVQSRLAPRGELAASTAQADGGAERSRRKRPKSSARPPKRWKHCRRSRPWCATGRSDGPTFDGVGQYWQQKYAAPRLIEGATPTPSRPAVLVGVQIPGRGPCGVVVGHR